MKLPLWRRERAVYPLTFTVETRYRDQDVLAHINNTSLSGYFDEVREKLMRSIHAEMTDGVRVRIVTADVRVSFLGEVFHPDVIDVPTGILRVGNSSWEIGQAMFQNGRCVALANSTLVQTGERGGEPLRPAIRAALEARLIREPA